MPPKRAQKSRSRQTTPQSPPKQHAPYVSPRQSRRTTRSASQEINSSPVPSRRTAKALPAVDEESGSESAIDVVPREDQSAVNSPDSALKDDAPSDDGITDTSSNGTTQLETLDSDLLIDNLSALHHASSQILSLFDPDDADNVIRDANDTTTKLSKRLQNFALQFKASRVAYGDGSYLDIALILRKLAKDESITDGPWRPDAILQHANLYLLMGRLFHTDEPTIYDTLQRMFNAFPEPFGYCATTTDQTRYTTQLVKETISFGIALRTQFFIKIVEQTKNSPTFDPDALLQQVFFDEDGNISGFQPEGEPTSSEAEDTIQEHLKAIRQFFRGSSKHSIHLKHLKENHSRTYFLTEALHWVFLRRKELELQIAAQGGPSSIQRRLEGGDLSPYQQDTPHLEASPKVSKTGGPESHEQQEKVAERVMEHSHNARQTPKDVLHQRIARFKAIQAEDDDDEEDSEHDEDADGANIDKSVTKGATPSAAPANAEAAVAEIPQSPDVAAEDEGAVDGVGYNWVDGGGDDEDDEEAQPEEEPEGEPEAEPVPQSSPPRPTQNSIVPTQQTLAVLEVARQQAVLGNKENIDTTKRYIDKQPNARRMEWDDSQPGQKRTREATEDDVDEDSEDFETDIRPQKRRRMPKPPPLSVADAADEWIAADDDDDADEIEDQAAQQLHDDILRSSPRRQPSASSQPAPHRSPLERRKRNQSADVIPSSSSAPQLERRPRHHQPTDSTSPVAPVDPSSAAAATRDYHVVNKKAKANVRLLNRATPGSSSQTLLSQRRRAWTDAEVQRLRNMIALYGCAWSQILDKDLDHSEGPALQDRNQVQLKDKARNMKMDYLKAGSQLPVGFAAVTIKSSDKALLDDLGLPYE